MYQLPTVERHCIKRIAYYTRHFNKQEPCIKSVSAKLYGVIGLEIHAQINSKTKLFSSSRAHFGDPPNFNVSPFDAAWPGTLPVLNRYCVEAAIRTALTFHCDINMKSEFDRKHYFYADMPAGYQITQQRNPIARGGWVDYVLFKRGKHTHASRHRVRLHQIQLEMDSGKSQHDPHNATSLIDLNRAGTGLLEIVTKPEFTSGEQAAAFVREVQATLRLINVCNGKMEEGSLRVDANVSVHEPDQPLGVRTEVKNLNSLRSVKEAIDFEIKRQTEIIAEGGEVINETLSYDTSTRSTRMMRDKERLQDYRFMAEPNLPPIVLVEFDHQAGEHNVSIESERNKIPELRADVISRLTGHPFDQFDLTNCQPTQSDTGEAETSKSNSSRRHSDSQSDLLSLEKAMTLLELDLVEGYDCLLRHDPSNHRLAYSFMYSIITFLSDATNQTPQDIIREIGGEEILIKLYSAKNEQLISGEGLILLVNEILGKSGVSFEELLQKYKLITDEEIITQRINEFFQRNPKVVPSKWKKRDWSRNFKLTLERIKTDNNSTLDIKALIRILTETINRGP